MKMTRASHALFPPLKSHWSQVSTLHIQVPGGRLNDQVCGLTYKRLKFVVSTGNAEPQVFLHVACEPTRPISAALQHPRADGGAWFSRNLRQQLPQHVHIPRCSCQRIAPLQAKHRQLGDVALYGSDGRLHHHRAYGLRPERTARRSKNAEIYQSIQLSYDALQATNCRFALRDDEFPQHLLFEVSPVPALQNIPDTQPHGRARCGQRPQCRCPRRSDLLNLQHNIPFHDALQWQLMAGSYSIVYQVSA